MPENRAEMEVWWSAYLATLAGGKAGRQAKMTASEALEHYREAHEYVDAGESWDQ